MRLSYTRAFALLVAIAFALPAYAQRGSIVGNVIDKDGKPLAGATVAFDRDEVKFHAEVKTEKNGNYTRIGLEDGTYRVTISQNGATLLVDNVVVSLGFRVDKNFDVRNAGAQPAGGGATISKAQQDAEKKANTDTQGAFNAGMTALTSRNYDEAIKQFSLAAQRQPKAPVIFARLGETYLGAKKPADALDAFKKAADLKADEPDYHYQLGLLYMQNPATMADAASQFDKYLQLAPKGENAVNAKALGDAAKAAGK